MRKTTRAALFAAFTLTSIAGLPASTTASEWSPVIIARGPYRAKLQSMPIEQRPYRPLHIYGNAVRLNRELGDTDRPIDSILVVTQPLRLLGIRP